jgi:hypothetical protein
MTVASLVENTRTVLQSTYHELKTDVHIIPTEWHSKLHGLVDDRMSLASLKTVPKGKDEKRPIAWCRTTNVGIERKLTFHFMTLTMKLDSANGHERLFGRHSLL